VPLNANGVFDPSLTKQETAALALKAFSAQCQGVHFAVSLALIGWRGF